MNRLSTLLSTPIPSAASKSRARRLTIIAAFVLLLAVPAWAQRGGGGGGARGGGGGLGARGGGFAGRAGIGGGRVGAGTATRAMPGHPGFSAHPSHRPSGGFGHSHGSRWQSGRFGRNRFPNCWGYGCWNWANPWWGYYPYGWGGYDPYYEHDHEHDYNSSDAADRESSEDARMAPPWASYGYPYPYAPPPPPAPRAASEAQSGAPIIPATVLVFRDRRRQEVQSYAIVGPTLWNFTSPQQVEKISLSDLDLAATVKANSERGRSFRIPSQRGAGEAPPVPSNT